MPKKRRELSEQARAAMVALLDARLADALDLTHQLHHAFWNLARPLTPLHEDLDLPACNAQDASYALAERAEELGGAPNWLLDSVTKRSSLPPMAERFVDGRACVEAAAGALAAFGAVLRASIDAAEKADDKSTADLFTALSSQNSEDLRALEAAMQSPRAGRSAVALGEEPRALEHGGAPLAKHRRRRG